MAVDTTLRWAERYLTRGWQPIPVPRGTKGPTLAGWQNMRLTSAQLPDYFSNGANIGLLLGKPSAALVEVDLDCAAARDLAPDFLPQTGLVSGRSESPRSHYWYHAYPLPATAKFVDPSKLGNGGGGSVLVELRSTGCQTLVEPSIHPTGDRYEWQQQQPPGDVSGPALHASVAKLAAAALLANYWADGKRHELALAVAGMLLRSGWELSDAEHFIGCVARAASDNEPEDRRAACRTTFGALGAGRRTTGVPTLKQLLPAAIVDRVTMWLDIKSSEPPKQAPEASPEPETTVENGSALPLTDVGNSERLARLLKDRFRYVDGQFKRYDGLRWRGDTEYEHIRVAKRVGADILSEASRIENDDERARAARWGSTSQSAQRIEAMVKLVRPDVVALYDTFDADPFLLNCTNGTLDLRNGLLSPHRAADFISKLCPVSYNPAAKCPKFEEFVSRIFRADWQLIEFLQRAVGYSLTGSTIEQCLFIACGTGANGKSTLVSVIEYVFGDYSKSARAETFLAQRSDSIPCDLADLAGARFVSTIDTDDGRRLAEGLVKGVTGGDRIKARFLHQNFFEFRPAFKLWLATNHRPRIRGTDLGIWRRIRLIPFEVSIPVSEQDKELPDRLRDEAQGILAWAVKGCLEWQRNGLGSAAAVDTAVADYKRESDVVRSWIDEQCILDADARTANKVLLDAFNAWARAGHERELSGRELGRRLAEVGFKDYRTGAARGWCGIAIGA